MIDVALDLIGEGAAIPKELFNLLAYGDLEGSLKGPIEIPGPTFETGLALLLLFTYKLLPFLAEITGDSTTL